MRGTALPAFADPTSGTFRDLRPLAAKPFDGTLRRLILDEQLGIEQCGFDLSILIPGARRVAH